MITDINKLIDLINSINSTDYSYSLYLFKKREDQINIYHVNFEDELENIVNEGIKSLIRNFSKKATIENYNAGKAKYLNLIGVDNTIFKNSFDKFLNCINTASSDKLDELYSVTGYFVKIHKLSDTFYNDIYIFYKKNPIVVTAKTKRKFTLIENTLKAKQISNSIFSFTSAPHFIILDNIIYSENLYFEDVFNLDKAIVTSGKNKIAELSKFSYLNDNFIDYLYKLKEAKIKIFSNLRIDYQKILNDTNISEFCSFMDLEYDSTNKKIVCETEEDCEKIYDAFSSNKTVEYFSKQVIS